MDMSDEDEEDEDEDEDDLAGVTTLSVFSSPLLSFNITATSAPSLDTFADPIITSSSIPSTEADSSIQQVNATDSPSAPVYNGKKAGPIRIQPSHHSKEKANIWLSSETAKSLSARAQSKAAKAERKIGQQKINADKQL
jgi:hypothetical protein